MRCAQARRELGVYALKALEPPRSREVAEHVEHCPACAQTVAEFEGVAALLDRVPLRAAL